MDLNAYRRGWRDQALPEGHSAPYAIDSQEWNSWEEGRRDASTGRPLVPAVIELKTHPPVFQDVLSGVKTFEFRRDDRGFRVGDFLYLREWDPDAESYTGRVDTRKITYILLGGDFGVPVGYCVVAIV